MSVHLTKLEQAEKDRKDKKKATKAKNKKEAEDKEAKKQEKIRTQHEEKLENAKAAKGQADKLKVWLSNPPFECDDQKIIDHCYDEVVKAISKLETAEQDSLYAGLSVNEAAILQKYISAIYHKLTPNSKDDKGEPDRPKDIDSK